MTTKESLSLILIFGFLTCLSVVTAQERSPHGLANEYPMVLPPSAYEFFHPTTEKPDSSTSSCGDTHGCSPMPLAAQVEAADQGQAHSQESKMLSHHNGGSGLGAGGIAGILFGLALVVLMAMGVYYIVATRMKNVDRVKAVQPDA